MIASGGQASGFLRDCLELFKMSIGCSPEPCFCSYRVTANYVDSDKIMVAIFIGVFYKVVAKYLVSFRAKIIRNIGRALRQIWTKYWVYLKTNLEEI